jgi:anti-sigma B factor antagonist
MNYPQRMNIESPDGLTLRVSGLTELAAANAAHVRDSIRAALHADSTALEVDLSETTFLDSSGLGALIALHKTMRSRNRILRILKPGPSVMQVLELTRLHRLFEVINPGAP